MKDTANASPAWDELHRRHVAELQQRAERALSLSGHEALLIASGVEKYGFLDDRPYLFQPNPHFKAWAPLCAHPDSWLLVRPGHKPLLVYYQPDDYWHVPPAPPTGFWVEQFELRIISAPEQALQHLPASAQGLAIVGEADAALQHLVPNNPQPLLDSLHWQRAVKTDYELQSLRQASRLAARAHLAAREAFLGGGSEAEIHRAYLVASGHTDRDLPYGNIVGINEHAAVLHYQYQDSTRPTQPRSLLVDAGAQVHGYASDITRTWSFGGAQAEAFEALLAAMEQAQLALVDEVRAGCDYRDIHLSTHRHIARILREQGLVRMSEEAMLAQQVTSAFFPHGIGHLLGLQVHDAGGFLASEQGGTRDKPAGHRYLRLTRDLLPGMCVTIEPGLYFIPTLLRQLRASSAGAAVDWARVEQLLPFGGIRIEDDVVCRAQGAPENLSRDAFAALG
ncbi:Xaa-Pro dipeptidase [Roseateles sp. BYS180W]|uniref:Xaa-Pro dipeptidase n=1 Tax=Roseateles rivi TaxID=3299028 RepID=A0ABW7FR09_9BURK